MKKGLLAILTAGVCMLGLAGCNDGSDSEGANGNVWNMQTVYAQAKELGYDGTLEDFMATVSGVDGVDGKDGVGIEDIYINKKGELIVKLTKGADKNLGVIGEATGEQHKHVWDETVEIRKATCSQSGVVLEICSDCGEGKYTVIEKLSEKDEHSFSNGVCTVCGERVFVVNQKWSAPITGATVLHGYGFYHNATLNAYYEHTGVDFAAEVGAEVCVVADGTIESIYKDDILLGTEITVDHGDGLKSVYRFVNEAEGLIVGQTVNKGDVIATVAEANGNEYKDGAHLHFEVLENNANVDPMAYLDIWTTVY
ncbi:MAG: M23 family metallopeptidase [Clostridia bacterium]|nr:M23 family metallopeptidase [Clostridia bacterium]